MFNIATAEKVRTIDLGGVPSVLSSYWRQCSPARATAAADGPAGPHWPFSRGARDPDPREMRSGTWGAWTVVAALCASCAQRSAPIRIGLNSWPGYEFVYLAKDLGIYAELGLAVEVREFTSLADARRAYERDQIDVLCGTPIEILHAADRGVPSRVFLVADSSAGADEILARKPITEVAALAGKRVAVEPDSLNLFLLSRALEKHGMKLADVEVVPLSQIAMPDALAAKKVDAIVSYPPISVQVKSKQKDVVRIFDSSQLPDEILDVLACRQNRLTDAQREGIVEAFFRARRAFDEDPERCAAIMARREGITAPQFRAALTGGLQLASRSQQARLLAPDGAVDRSTRRLARILFAAAECDRILRHAIPASPPR